MRKVAMVKVVVAAGVSLVLAVGAALLVRRAVHAAEPPPHVAAVESPDGLWLPQSAQINSESQLDKAWTSKITISAGSFRLSHFITETQDLHGSFTLNPASRTIDITTEEIDMSQLWEGIKYPRSSLPGIYTLDHDTFTVCLQLGTNPQRPADFVSHDRRTLLFSLTRADVNFKDFPKDITLTVLDPAGKPAPGAAILKFMSRGINRDRTPTDWKISEAAKTKPDGTAVIPYDLLATHPAMARDTARHFIGFTAVSPASLQNAAAIIQLQPQCLLSGSFTCDEIKKARQPMESCAYLLMQGQRVAFCSSLPGEFEFPVPPGDYTLQAYGDNLRTRYLDITVPPGQTNHHVPPIPLTASNLIALVGKAAPELEGVVAWKDGPVKLADLRGNIVLLNFWGYWCGPCVAEMPALMDLLEKFHDRSLVIIGVHVDRDGEVDTLAKLAEKTATTQKELWKGKNIPFPIALTSGHLLDLKKGEWQRGSTSNQYGILCYPTTILIDKQGNLLGHFDDIDPNHPERAIAAIEKLLGQTK